MPNGRAEDRLPAMWMSQALPPIFRTGSSAVPAAILAAALAGVAPPPAYAQSPMIQGWLAANAQCKSGPADDARTRQACATRDRLGEKLERRGCAYHEDGEWWKCAR